MNDRYKGFASAIIERAIDDAGNGPRWLVNHRPEVKDKVQEEAIIWLRKSVQLEELCEYLDLDVWALRERLEERGVI